LLTFYILTQKQNRLSKTQTPSTQDIGEDR